MWILITLPVSLLLKFRAVITKNDPKTSDDNDDDNNIIIIII